MNAPTIIIRTAPVGIRQSLLARAANLGSVRVSGTDAAPAPAAPAVPAIPPADPPAAVPTAEAPPPGEPDADPTQPKKPDGEPAESDATDGGPPADPADVADVCARAGQGARASGFIRARASMAAVRLGLLANSAAIFARFNGRPTQSARSSAAAPGGSTRVDAAGIIAQFNATAQRRH